MTRKRFIKLLMGKGVSRNAAHEIAKNAIKYYKSYKKAYSVYMLKSSVSIGIESAAFFAAMGAIERSLIALFGIKKNLTRMRGGNAYDNYRFI